MKGFQFAVPALLAAIASLSSPALAQNYASPAGTGTNCSADAPCSLTTAMNLATNNDGITIACINGGSAFLPSFSTSNSFEVDCPGGRIAGDGSVALTLSGTSAQVVKLRHLLFSGYANSEPNKPMIRVTGGATLIIENCKFEDEGQFGGPGGPPIAIRFEPTSPAAQLIIRDSVFSNNGIAPGSGGGLQVEPGSGGSAGVVLERVTFNYNVTSMVLGGAVDAVMSNSIVSASRSNGVLVGSGATLNIKDSMLVHNVGSAISVSSGGTVRLSNNDIEGNQIGISNSGGQALTFSNNRVVANGSTATLTPIQGGQ